MRIVPFLLSATVTAALVFTLNIQLKLGGTKAPRLELFFISTTWILEKRRKTEYQF